MRTPTHLGGMNGDVQYDLSTLASNNREQLEDLNGIIIRPQQEITLYWETVSPTRLLFQYTNELSNINKLKSFIAPNTTDLITLLDNNRTLALYTVLNIHGINHYIEIIGSPTTLTTLGHHYHNFGPSSSTNIDTSNFQPVMQLYALDRRLFVNAVEELYTRLMPALSMAITSYHQVSEEIWINSTTFTVINQLTQK